MRVAIAQVDGKWPNLALAKIAAWHTKRGDAVERFWALDPPRRVYASKTFDGTPDDPYLPDYTKRGGTGYLRYDPLPARMEKMRPDWSLWPTWEDDIGYTTRGCPRRCSFCVVPKTDGKLRVVSDFGGITTGRSVLHLLDGNITAAPLDHFRAVCEDAWAADVTLDFSQGLDARLLTDEHAAILRRTKTTKAVRMAFDHVKDEQAVRAAVATMKRSGWPASRLMFYVLIGYDSTPEEDMYRVQLVRSLGADPFVMKFKRDDPRQTRFARWVNNVVAFNAMTWDEWCATFKTPLREEGAA